MQEQRDFIDQSFGRADILQHAGLGEVLEMDFFLLREFARGINDDRDFAQFGSLANFVDEIEGLAASGRSRPVMMASKARFGDGVNGCVGANRRERFRVIAARSVRAIACAWRFFGLDQQQRPVSLAR